MVRVAAVDVEKARDVASQLQQTYGFQVKGVPTIIMLKPKVSVLFVVNFVGVRYYHYCYALLLLLLLVMTATALQLSGQGYLWFLL